ncbi:MAG TPA: acetoacetate--CoA ligase [Steroidobacteraceae bacterium]|jgi:acetoacetyl-CoA synthetase|nr:acetoacetate--CoA ligase [Steroidobacteraceae bacterium]
MTTIEEGALLWTPPAERIAAARLTDYLDWLAARGRQFDSYAALWQWSVSDLEGFWGSMWQYFDIRASQPFERVLARRTMPGAQWFPGARLNYAEHVLRHERDGVEALLYLSERRQLSSVSWTELGDQVRRLATYLRSCGLEPGDRVVAYLPNSPEAVVAMLATVSVGAIWASCGPDFGARGVVDRFSQLEPRLAFCVDGYYYGGKAFDRRPELRSILGELPTLERVIYLRRLHPMDAATPSAHTTFWEQALAAPAVPRESFVYEQVAFAHPLWILFSSGTTGLPKPIVHCHGGITLEHFKGLAFHMDVHARERMFFFTTTGWMMWNFLVSALLLDVVPVLYDGNPAYPEPDVLWRLVEQTRASFFGASPTYVGILEKAGIVPGQRFDLGSLNSVLLAGSPVTAECMAWVYRNVKSDIWAHSGSGGTDLCTGIAGGVVTLPIYAGEIQARQLGVAAYAFDERGRTLVDEVGELVITQPLPSMPVGLWNDVDGSRYRDSYFDQYPGIWRHGDFFKVNSRGGCFVLGRSDATLNRHGVRIGTAEVYRSLLNVPEIEDALIVNLDLPGGRFFMPLFVKLRAGHTLDVPLKERIRSQMRSDYSPRHVPDEIYAVEAIPYTLTGKKMEVPVRRILMGVAADKAANRSAMANVQALDYFIDYARTHRPRLLSGQNG